jgi:hypothetical protein
MLFPSMFLKSLITGIAVFLAGLFGCSKTTTPAAAKTPAAAQPKVKDLGVLAMTNDYETCVSFGPGKDCRIIPKVLGRDSVQLTITIESKGPNGQTSGLSVVQVTGSTSKPFDLSVGGMDYTFTPQIAAE